MSFLLDQVGSLDLVKYQQAEGCSWVPSSHVSATHVGVSSMASLLTLLQDAGWTGGFLQLESRAAEGGTLSPS